MKFKICWEKDGFEDYALVEGDTFEEISDKANEIVTSRNLENYWSEEIS